MCVVLLIAAECSILAPKAIPAQHIGGAVDRPVRPLNQIINIHYCICYGLSEPPWYRGKFHSTKEVDCLPADNCPYTCNENAWQDFADTW